MPSSIFFAGVLEFSGHIGISVETYVRFGLAPCVF